MKRHRICRFGYATIKKTIVEQVEVHGPNQPSRRPKLRVVLSRAENFKELMEKTMAVRKENEEALKIINEVEAVGPTT